MKILDPGHDPILGRLHGFNRKHRLRTKHYAEIEDFPPDGSFDVLDPSRLGAVDFYKKLGYQVAEKSYLLFDEIQHFQMRKTFHRGGAETQGKAVSK